MLRNSVTSRNDSEWIGAELGVSLPQEVLARGLDLAEQVGAGRVYLGHQRCARGLKLGRNGAWQRTGGRRCGVRQEDACTALLGAANRALDSPA
jgi:hypothetical protein